MPEGVDESDVRQELLKTYSIEIGAGLGELKDKVWRIGLMGDSCNETNVIILLSALEQILLDRGADLQLGKAVKVAVERFSLTV